MDHVQAADLSLNPIERLSSCCSLNEVKSNQKVPERRPVVFYNRRTHEVSQFPRLQIGALGALSFLIFLVPEYSSRVQSFDFELFFFRRSDSHASHSHVQFGCVF